jgi:hypothetical protein
MTEGIPMETDECLPKEVSRAQIELAPGLIIEVVHLDNGMRLITEDSMSAVVNWLEAGKIIIGTL